MYSDLSVFIKLFEILPLQVVALAVCIILMWKGWHDVNLRIIAICFLVITLNGFFLEMLSIVQDYIKHNFGKAFYNGIGFLFLAIRIINELAMVCMAAASIWLFSGYENGKITGERPVKRIATFAAVVFFFTLAINVLYYSGQYLFEIDIKELEIISMQFLIMQLVSSQVLLLSIFYAMCVVIPKEHREISTSKTLWLLMVPIFGAYWILKVLKQWAISIENIYDEHEFNKLPIIARAIVKFTYVIVTSIVVFALFIEFNAQTRGNFDTIEWILAIAVNMLILGYGYKWFELLLGIKRLEDARKNNDNCLDEATLVAS